MCFRIASEKNFFTSLAIWGCAIRIASHIAVASRDLGWDPAGLVWHGKRPKAGNGKKMEIEMENGPKLDRGKNGKKMAQKWKNNGKLPQKSIFWPFFCHFAPVQLGAVFHFDFHFFSISGFWPFSMPCKPGRIPRIIIWATKILQDLQDQSPAWTRNGGPQLGTCLIFSPSFAGRRIPKSRARKP